MINTGRLAERRQVHRVDFSEFAGDECQSTADQMVHTADIYASRFWRLEGHREVVGKAGSFRGLQAKGLRPASLLGLWKAVFS